MTAQVLVDDLEEALYWVSASNAFEAAAFVSRTSGRIYFRGPDGPVEDDFPDDIEDGTEYLAVPHKNDLDLGRDLVFRFMSERAPRLEPQVRDLFRRRGAYQQYKGLLQRHRLLDDWHAYERDATRLALEGWARDNGLALAARQPAVPAVPSLPARR